MSARKKSSKGTTSLLRKPRSFDELVKVEHINTLLVTNTATGYRAKMLVVVNGEGYWLEAPVKGTVTLV